MSAYNFFVSGPKFTKFFSIDNQREGKTEQVHIGNICSWNNLVTESIVVSDSQLFHNTTPLDNLWTNYRNDTCRRHTVMSDMFMTVVTKHRMYVTRYLVQQLGLVEWSSAEVARCAPWEQLCADWSPQTHDSVHRTCRRHARSESSIVSSHSPTLTYWQTPTHLVPTSHHRW